MVARTKKTHSKGSLSSVEPNDLGGRSISPVLTPVSWDETTKRQWYGQWRQGVSCATLAHQNGLKPSTVTRGVNEVRAERLFEQKLEYIYDASFEADDAEAVILAPMTEVPHSTTRTKSPAAAPPQLSGEPL